MYKITSSLLKIDIPGSLRSIFMKRCDFEKPEITNKITIVGLSPISISIILTLFNDATFGRICCFDLNKQKVQAELSELIVKAPKRFICGSDYEITANSDVIVIAFDIEFSMQKSLRELILPYEKILKEVIPKIAELSPNAIYVNANRPNNILTYVIYKLSKAPKNKVFGIGTYPETLKLQYHLGELLDLSPTSILVQTIGSRADPIPLWNSLSAGGVLIKDMFGDDTAFNELLNDIKKRRDKLSESKHFLDWTTAFSVWLILLSILINRTALIPLSCHAQDIYDIKEEIFLSVPCCLSRNGIAYAVKPKLTEKNRKKISDLVNKQLILQKELNL